VSLSTRKKNAEIPLLRHVLIERPDCQLDKEEKKKSPRANGEARPMIAAWDLRFEGEGECLKSSIALGNTAMRGILPASFRLLVISQCFFITIRLRLQYRNHQKKRTSMATLCALPRSSQPHKLRFRLVPGSSRLPSSQAFSRVEL
jgi:hypothetical protein